MLKNLLFSEINFCTREEDRITTNMEVTVPPVFGLIATLMQLLTRSAQASGEPRRPPALDVPAVFPATILYSDSVSSQGQCEDIRRSPVGRHALNDINSDVHDQLVNKIAPAIARSRFPYGKCAFGHCEENPVFSCDELKEIDEESQSGLYWVRLSNGFTVKVYCDFDQRCDCSQAAANSSAWMRVAFFNMSHPNQQCPFNFLLNEIQGRRLCHTKHKGCTSIFFNTFGFQFSKVCGRVNGIQFGEPNAFRPYFKDKNRSLEDQYVDGISLTHGRAPRTHVWTFVMVEDETQSDDEGCPCTVSDAPYTGVVPPFIGNDYFCDTGSHDQSRDTYYLDNPLWDGRGCGAGSTCCQWQSPPWFCKTLPEPTRNDLEFRVCADSSSDDELLLLELIEIYIQ